MLKFPICGSAENFMKEYNCAQLSMQKSQFLPDAGLALGTCLSFSSSSSGV